MNKRGFTLIELLISVALVGILVIAIFSVLAWVGKTSNTVRGQMESRDSMETFVTAARSVFRGALNVQWSTNPLEGQDYSSGTGFVRSYNYDPITSGTTPVLLAVFSQRQNASAIVLLTAGLYFIPPTNSAPGYLRLVNDTNASGQIDINSYQLEQIKGIVGLTLDQARTAADGSLRGFRLKITSRSFSGSDGLNGAKFCSGTNCPKNDHTFDQVRSFYIFLASNAASVGTLPIGEFSLPMSGVSQVR